MDRSIRNVDEEIQTDVAVSSSVRHPRVVLLNEQELNHGLNQAHMNDEAHIIACDYINYRLHVAGFEWTDRPPMAAEPNRLCLIMRTLGEEFERRYVEAFRDLITRLQITPATVYPTFLSVCQELFRGQDDQQLDVKWGRIVALYSFAGALAVQCVDSGMPQQVSKIADWVTLYTQTYLSNWIAAHDGWNGLIQFYEKTPNEERWSSFKKIMAGFGVAVAGIGLGAALLAGRS